MEVVPNSDPFVLRTWNYWLFCSQSHPLFPSPSWIPWRGWHPWTTFFLLATVGKPPFPYLYTAHCSAGQASFTLWRHMMKGLRRGRSGPQADCASLKAPTQTSFSKLLHLKKQKMQTSQGVVAHTYNLYTRRLRQEDCCEFQVNYN